MCNFPHRLKPHFLAFLLCIFRCLIPLFWSCIWAELYPPLIPVQHIVLRKERKYIVLRKERNTLFLEKKENTLFWSRKKTHCFETERKYIVLRKERKHINVTKGRKHTVKKFNTQLTSLAVICNFLLQLFLKPGFPLLQRFAQSETKWVISLLAILKNLKSETKENLIIGDSQKQLWFVFFSRAWSPSFEPFSPSGLASCSPCVECF